MSILNFQLGQVGEEGIEPRFIFFNTNDTVATVTTAGYLNKFVEQGNKVSETDMAVVVTRLTPNARVAQVNLFNVSFSAGDWSFTANSTPNTLLNGLIFIGNASDVATGVSMSGDATISNSGVLTISNNAITNAKVSASAAIAFSKLAALTSGNIIVGSAGNVPTAVTMSGDATISDTGALTIANSAITDAKVSASAAIAFSKLAALTSGLIIVGSAGNVPTAVTMSGDATIIASGALTISAGVVTLAKLAAGVAPAGVVKFMGQHTTVGGAAAEVITVTGAVAATDRAFVQMVNNGTGNVTVVEAVVTNDTLTVTFSADPGNDAIVNYQLLRAAS